ncbi:MAG: Alpha/beta hydrolase fold-3 domain protein [Aeromicrobium sp.]|nr:Alpha/beta hydrolase fold-3 domain protein [Aeromicrobium sp.]
MPIPRVKGVRVERKILNGVPSRLYIPRSAEATTALGPALLWLHGGGYVIGHPRQDDLLCKSTAAELNCVVVSPDYRLAPRSPFPAAHDDCLAVWQWLTVEPTGLSIDPGRVALGGQSAGGGLALGLAVRIRDQQTVRPGALWLFAPMLDDNTATKHELDKIQHAVWDNRRNRHAWHSYLAMEPGSEQVSPYSAPARASDLSGLPPTWVGVGDVDLFHDEVVRFAERMRTCGNEIDVSIVRDGFHGFESIARNTVTARTYVRDAKSWLQRHLYPAT